MKNPSIEVEGFVYKRQGASPRDFRFAVKKISWVVITSVTGTLGGIFFMQIALKYIDAALAQCMFATSPVFLLLIEYLAGYKVRFECWLGMLMAVSGVVIIFLSFS